MAGSEAPGTHRTQAAEFLSGTTVGRFVIGELLGHGGMGEVYRAEDTKLRRTVALKRMAPCLRADPTYHRRLLKEAESSSRLNNSHIAAIYDVLEEADETFLVMEYVEGQTLRQRLCQPLTFEQFLEIALQCADAVIAAHERGIIHGDIKPENIMLTSAGQVKLLDFGLAKHLPRSEQSSTLERGATLGGTPAYMAPEVLLEKIPDQRADIFSLGVVFYEALAGRHPFLAKSFVATSERILRESPVPVTALNPSVPRELQAIISRMLAKQPEQRYSSARELASEITKLQGTPDGNLVLTKVPAKRFRRNLLALTVLAAIFALGVLSPRIYRRLHSPLLKQRGWIVITDFDDAGSEPVPDQALREGLTIALQQSRYINVYPRPRMYDVLKRMERTDVVHIDENLGREICRREGLDLLLAGSIARFGDSFQIVVRAEDPIGGEVLFAEKTQFRGKGAFFQNVDWLAGRVRSHLGESLTGIEHNSRPLAKVTTTSLEALQLYSEATDAVAQGKLERVPGVLQSALLLDPNFAVAHLRLGEYYAWVVGKNQNAIAELQRAYDLRQGVTDRERLWIEADYYEMQENYEKATESLATLAGLYPDDAEAHQRLGLAYYNLGQTKSVVSELRRALELNPHSAPAYGKLVLSLARSNQNEDAIRVYQQASQQGLQSTYLDWGLGLAYLGQGDVARARAQFQRVTQGSDTDRALGHLYLAVADLHEGKLRVAKEELTSSLLNDKLSAEGLQLVCRYILGRIYLMQGNKRRAERQAELILAAPEAELQTNDIQRAGTLYALAGSINLARRVLRQLDAIRKRAPTAWNNSSFQALKGEIALAEGNTKEAVASFQDAAAQYEDPVAYRGMARSYQRQQDWSRAAQQWERFLHDRGEILQNEFPVDLAVAHLELARTCRQLKNAPCAEVHYQSFLHMWQQADDLPVRRLAAREYQETQSASQ